MENKIIQAEHMHFKDTLCTHTLVSTPNSTVKNETNPTVQQFNRLVENYCKKIAIENGARQNTTNRDATRVSGEKERTRERERERERERD